MSDISEQQMDELISAMNKSAGSLSKIADGAQAASIKKDNRADAVSNAARQAKAEDTRQTKEHSSAVKKSVDGFTKLAGTIAGFFTAKNIIDASTRYGQELTKTYRDLSNYGQSFSGNLLRLGQLAGKAGLPLDQFAAAVKHNSVVINQLGIVRFAELSKGVRKLTQQAGMYGFTVEQLNEFGIDLMETQRAAGKNLSAMSADSMAHRIQGFALNVTAVSDALGAQRDVVMQMTVDALRQENVASAARLNNMRGMSEYNDAITDATAALAAQPGEAGKLLSKGLADAFGSINGSLFTDLGQSFIQAGVGAGAQVIDEANKRLAAGEDAQKVAMDVAKNMDAVLNNDAQLESLRLLAQTKGPAAQAAQQLLAIARDVKVYSQADLDAKKKDRAQADAVTGFMLSFGDVVNRLKGSLIEGFLTPFMTMGKLDPAKVEEFWKGIESLALELQKFGTQFAELMKTFFTRENITALGSGIIGVIKLTMEVTKAIGGIVGMMTSAFKVVHDSMKFLFGEKFAGFATVLAGLTAWFASKALINAIMGGLTKMISGDLVTVTGRVVNVNGGGAGGGFGDYGDLDGKEKGKGGAGGRRGTSRAMDARLRKLKASGMSKGLQGEQLAKYMMKGARGNVATRAFARVADPIESLVSKGGMAGGALKGVGKIGSFVGKHAGALGGVLMAVSAVSSLNEIKDAVAAGKMTPEEGKKASLKMLGGMAAGIGGSLIAGAAAGAIMGSVVPGPGTVLGGIVGGAVGLGAAVLGGAAASSAGSWATGKAYDAIAGKPAAASAPGSPAAVSRAGAATPNVTPKPRVLDDRIVAQMRTDAILGDKGAIEALRKIEESLRNQTAILASQQAKNTQAVRETNSTLKTAGGFAAG